MGAERTEIPLLVKGTGRAHTVLKNSMCPYSTPEGFMGAERTEMPLPVKGTERAYTELKKQYVPV